MAEMTRFVIIGALGVLVSFADSSVAAAEQPAHPPADPHPDTIAGKWRASGTIRPPNGGRGMSWLKEYTFHKNGTFVMTGYPPILVTGKWRVLAIRRTRMRLVLTNQQMRMSKRDKPSRWPDRADWVESDGKTMKWGKELHHRRRK